VVLALNSVAALDPDDKYLKMRCRDRHINSKTRSAAPDTSEIIPRRTLLSTETRGRY